MATEDDVRRVALSLPGTSERSSYGTPGFRVRDRHLARLHDQPGVLVLWRETVEEKDELITASPDQFFTTSHYDGVPLLLRLGTVDIAELTELLSEAWLARAPTALRGALGGR